MDQEQFSGWSPPRDDLEGLLAGLDSSALASERNGTAWSDHGAVPPSAASSQYFQETTDSGVVRSPLHHGRNSAPPLRPAQRRVASASQVSSLNYGDTGTAQGSFDIPLRSIFVSGPPTSSVSANTALASLSSNMASSSSNPVAALTSAGGSRRVNIRAGDIAPTVSPGVLPGRYPLLNLEKDVDDPTATSMGVTFEGNFQSTPAALNQLFMPSDSTSPAMSRMQSHIRSTSRVSRSGNDTSITGHLLHHGFEEGRHSDITIRAFGRSYRLHKLLLDRVPYFSSAFCGPWAESTAKEMTIMPEEIDANITRTAFELALKRIYGTHFAEQEEDECIGLFATACWLDMPELVDSCVDSILRQMQPGTLHSLIRLVTHNFYGKAGDRILSSAKAMLCREGWEMPYEYWDEIPAEIIREIVGGDPFFIPGEWDRWYLALKLLNRRLRGKAVENSLVSPGGRYLVPKPNSLRFFAVRFDTTYRPSGLNRYVSEKDEAWIALYTSPEVAPLLVLLDEGIHYVHLRFEQLQQIRDQRDILGVPVLPEKVISDALWMSMELRQKVLNAHDSDVELGLSEAAEEYEEDEFHEEQIASNKGKSREVVPETLSDDSQDIESGSWDGNAKPRKFWIPSNDVSCVMGGTREASLAANSTSVAEWTTHAARLSASLEPTDVAWALDFNTGNVIDSGRPPSRGYSPTSSPRYSHYPPFRFSAEFPHPRTLKEKKRVYSHTVWYAGSMWNLYIQRVHTSKVPQLGIYLHRAKDKDPSDDPLAQFIPASVDDRIGQLEREMLLRKNERRNRSWRIDESARALDAEHEDDYTGSPHDYVSSVNVGNDGLPNRRTGGPGRLQKTSQNPGTTNHMSSELWPSASLMLDSDEEDEELLRANRRINVSAMPPYMDTRPTIKTYFKIYSPSKAGRLLSIYESAPDKFDVSKSWGWKSSQMVLDDGLGAYDSTKATKDGRLRYMVVIGNI